MSFNVDGRLFHNLNYLVGMEWLFTGGKCNNGHTNLFSV
jgi:hypothetical protein